ncbi:hypothetical protein B0H16DRAFT_1452767 [Mycena metata]|uniref:Uncharacterized protein n=1 Tax=Mycena metata TaxID=1033252 RepID=A0AAD7NNG8_9AGAR|nr:hypothetical protein B0H16DRAFT_1452767 [Mycena metata]
MSCVPPRSIFTLPRRGKVVEIDRDMIDALREEYRKAARGRNAATVASTDPDQEGHVPNDDSDAEAISSDSDSDMASISSLSDDEMSLVSSDSDSGDANYIPPHKLIWDITVDGASPPYFFRRRTPSPPKIDVDVNPFPDSFRPAHLESLKFQSIRWNEQPGPFVDLHDRICAMYIGGPVEASDWERSIIQAGQEMLSARATLQKFGESQKLPNCLSGGHQYGGCRGNRPQNIHGFRPGSTEQVVLAILRHSVDIQAITSFQNAALQKMAPRAWASAHTKLQTLVEDDVLLHLPCDLACQHGPSQPTALSRVDYVFSTDTAPLVDAAAYIPSFTALTSLGNYDPASEGKLILWADKKVVDFPVGSTVFLPKWMPYSFTAVEWPSYQMLLKQSCENALVEYVDNGLCGAFGVVEVDEERRVQEAAEGRKLFSTLWEFDDQYEKAQ